MKIIKDNLYGFIEITPLALKIIDSKEFQRLRFIKQLGISHYVFPSAHHSRFEHSIGVYNLVNIFLDEISKKHKIDERLKVILSISGLIHDIGHVAFSHMFDYYIATKIKNFEHEHEKRSVNLFKSMNTKYKLGFTKKELILIENIILGNNLENYPKYIFQIIANKKNELDLDKIDYLMRDGYYLGKQVSFNYKYLFNHTKIINEEICFDVKTSFTIFSIFNMRYELHRNFYNHKTIVIHEVMITDAILSCFEEFDFDNMVKNDEWLYKFTDDYLLIKLRDFEKSRKIIDKIFSRNLYKIAPLNYKGDIVTISKHIGLTNKEVNPILNINFFDKNNKIIKLNMSDISIFKLNNSYQIKKFSIMRT